MKRVFIGLLTRAVAVAVATTGTALAAGTIRVSGPLAPQTVGATFAVPVQVTGVANLYAAQFDLLFNPNTLTALSVTPGAFLGTGGSTVFVPGTIDNTAGRIAFTAMTLIGPIPGVSGSGTLATITFRAKTTATSALTLSNVILLDSGLADIAVVVQNGAVGVPPIPLLSDGGLLLTSVLLCAFGLRFMRSVHARPD